MKVFLLITLTSLFAMAIDTSANSLVLKFPSTRTLKPNPENCVQSIKDSLKPLIKEQGLDEEVLTPPRSTNSGGIMTVQQQYKFMLNVHKIVIRGGLYKGSDYVFEAFLIGEDTGRGNPTYRYYVYRGELDHIDSKFCTAKNTKFYGTTIKEIWD